MTQKFSGNGAVALTYRRLDSLPALAWCAEMEISSGKVTVHHGPHVETQPDFFLDGAWNGDFAEGRLAEATVVCGTGGYLDENGVAFVSSSDRLCPVFSIVRENRVYVSNSHVFALTLSGEKLDACYPFYYYDIVEIYRRGLDAMAGSLPLEGGVRLGVHFSCILAVGRSGKLEFRALPDNERPYDYASYHRILSLELNTLLENAADPHRSAPSFGSITPLSQGYDTNATAALAMKGGCREAYTFYDPRKEKEKNDSGLSHAACFGMSCEELSRFQYRQQPSLNIAEFCLMGLSSQAPLAAVEHLLPGKILLNGSGAQLVWSKKQCLVSGDRASMVAPFASGVGQSEFRLRVGYVPFSPSQIGAEHGTDILKIHKDPEMKQWSVGGGYDRPIARRIAEEAGLPRQCFGMTKRGSGHSVLNSVETFSERNHAIYEAFMQKMAATQPPSLLARSRRRTKLRYLFWKCLGTNKRRPRKLNWWSRNLNFIGGTHPLLLPWKYLFSFHWGVEELKGRYQVARNP